MSDTSDKKWYEKSLYPGLPWVLLIVLTIGTGFLFPRKQGAFRFTDHTVGSISDQEIIAPFQFEILKSDEELDREYAEAREAVAPVYERNDSLAMERVRGLEGFLQHVKMAGDSIRTLERRQPAIADSISRRLWQENRNFHNGPLTYPSWRQFIERLNVSRTEEERGLPLSLLPNLLRDFYRRGILDQLPDRGASPEEPIRVVQGGQETEAPISHYILESEARGELPRVIRRELGERTQAQLDSLVRLGYEAMLPFLGANVFYDPKATAERRERAVAKIPLAKGIVLKDERIIDSNEKFSKEHIDILRSMEIKRAEMAAEEGSLAIVLTWVGRFLLPAIILGLLGYWLMRFRPDVFFKPNKLLLVCFLLALEVAFFGLVILPMNLSVYLFPAALGSIILTVVFDTGVAMIFLVALSMLVGALTGNNFFAVFATFFPAALAVFTVIRVRTRVQIMRSFLLILAGSLLVMLADRMLTLQMNMDILREIGWATINAFGSPLLALGMLIGIEYTFRVTTDLTLLELSDLNRPLLKRLSLTAPGTYHHSLLVGSLAEAAAEAIQANPLLVRAGAYYHDIGKMVRREYFVENQPGSFNIHSTLEPEDSARFLKQHVLDGIRMAKKYHLPESIKAFIREHHGTSLMVYFYNEALRKAGKDETVDENTYRYPGPKPQSKETGILMLADGSEAATRSLEDPTPEKIEESVRKIIINKYQDKELDECPLTLHEIHKVIEAFVPILEGMHHHRIRYPSREELEARHKEYAQQITSEAAIDSKENHETVE